MVDYTSMKGLWIFLFLLTLLSSGCGPEQGQSKESPATPTLTSDQSRPKSSSTPDEPGVRPLGIGSSSGSDSVGAAHTSAAQAIPEIKPNTQISQKELAVNPAEWRRKNFKSRAFSEFKDLRGYAEVDRLIPQPPSPTRIESGKRLYDQACVACHNLDGSPVKRDPALMRYNMADLSQPQEYIYGSSPKAIYRSIRYGVPSPPMGFTGEIYSQTEVWDMVNYIQSIQKRSRL